MAKLITQERIKAALEWNDRLSFAASRQDDDLITQAAVCGLKAQYGCLGRTDLDRLGLEVNYAGYNHNRAELYAVVERWRKLVDHYTNRAEKIRSLQYKYGVTGLTAETLTLGNNTLEIFWQDSCLNLIESDMPTLKAQKQRVFDFWANYVQANDLNIYRFSEQTEQWEKSSIAEAKLDKVVHDWAYCWESVHFYSIARMKEIGYSDLASKYSFEYPDKAWRVHLDLGVGYNTEAPGCRQMLCASNRVPSL